MERNLRSATPAYLRTLLLVTLVFVTIVVSNGQAPACSNGYFSFGGKTVVGRNMDWPKPEGYVVINERDITRNSLLVPKEDAVQWKSQYGNVTFNLTEAAKGIGYATVAGGGINEKGLYVAGLWAEDSKYELPSATDNRKAISVVEVIHFILDQCATVEEAIRTLQSVQVRAFDLGSINVTLHWFMADSACNTAYTEFPDRKLVVYRKPVPTAMTNDFYGIERDYLKAYEGFGGTRKIPASFDPATITVLDRFLLLSKHVNDAASGRRPVSVNTTFDALYSVRHVPKKDDAQHTSESSTDWTEVYDFNNRIIYWRSFHAEGTKSLNLDKIHFGFTGTRRILDIHYKGEGDMLENFRIIY